MPVIIDKNTNSVEKEDYKIKYPYVSLKATMPIVGCLLTVFGSIFVLAAPIWVIAMEEDKIFSIGLLMFLIGGLSACIPGIRMIWRNLNLKTNGEETSGTVIGYNNSSISINDAPCTAYVIEACIDGMMSTVVIDTSDRMPRYIIGDVVTIKYDKKSVCLVK